MGDKQWTNFNMYQNKPFDPRSNISMYAPPQVRLHGNFNYQSAPTFSHPPPSCPGFIHPVGNSISQPRFSYMLQNYSESSTDSQTINSVKSQRNFTICKNTEESDWMHNWIKTDVELKSSKKISGLKLQGIQVDVIKTAKLISKLESLDKAITNERHQPNSGNMILNTEIDNLKQQISTLLQNLHSPYYKTAAKQCLINRKDKRKITIQRRTLKKKLKLKEFDSRSKAIDEWRNLLIKQKQEEILDEKLKTDADKVLCEVRKKQEESQKMISLLEKLDELRSTRIKRLSASGVPVPDDRSKFFISLKENIKETINKQRIHYQLEEKTLRVMMEKTPSHVLLKKETLPSRLKLQAEIHQILFGSKDIQTTEESLSSLVEIRNEWDKFISISDMASSIPISWINPSQICSEEWQKYRCS